MPYGTNEDIWILFPRLIRRCISGFGVSVGLVILSHAISLEHRECRPHGTAGEEALTSTGIRIPTWCLLVIQPFSSQRWDGQDPFGQL